MEDLYDKENKPSEEEISLAEFAEEDMLGPQYYLVNLGQQWRS